jgi:hypothetical protein
VADILLSTKLSLPPVQKNWLCGRIIDRLNAGLERKLTLLSTPQDSVKQLCLLGLRQNRRLCCRTRIDFLPR